MELETLMKAKETAQKGKRLEANINCKKYLSVLKLEEAHTILLIRTGMVDVKANYKNKHTDLRCPMCNEEIETLKHLLTCLKYSTPPLDEQTLELIWSSGSSHEQIQAMSKAAKVTIKKLSERSESDSVSDRLQAEEGASTTAEAEGQ